MTGLLLLSHLHPLLLQPLPDNPLGCSPQPDHLLSLIRYRSFYYYYCNQLISLLVAINALVGWNLVEDHMESCLAAPTLELEAYFKKDLPRGYLGNSLSLNTTGLVY
jgi:hypothetical protein